MTRVHLVSLLLCALLPLQGLAQDPSAPPMVPALAVPEPPAVPGVQGEGPRGEVIPREWKTPESQKRTPYYGGLEFLGGALGGGIGGVPGIAGSLLLSLGCEGCDNGDTSIFLGIVGVAGFFGGTALGVKLVGDWTGGQGRFLPALGGAVLGFLGGVAVGGAFALLDSDILIVPPVVAGPFLGAVIGYELSDTSARERMAVEGTTVRVLPAVSVRPSGGVVAGLVGCF